MWLDKTKKGFSFQDKEKRRNTNKKSKKKAFLLTASKFKRRLPVFLSFFLALKLRS